MIPEEVFLKIVRSATKAPSGHNTQPWSFSVHENTISIQPDFSRKLPVVDADNHALYISLGCALENLIIASNYHGYKTKTKFIQQENCTIIQAELIKNDSDNPPDLYFQINKRQSNRSKYTVQPIKEREIESLANAVEENGLAVKFFRSKTEIGELKPFIIEGNNLQFQNKAFVNELVDWMRFSEKEVMHRGDGLWTASMGLPNMGKRLGRFVMSNFVSAKSEAKRWSKIIDNSAGFALFMTRQNTPESWIKLGRSFQRFGLTATKLNISHAHVNMPCEEITIRHKMVEHFNLKGFTPLLLIRFGYAKPLPYSFRRNILEVITQQ